MFARPVFALVCCLAFASCSSDASRRSTDAEGDTFVLTNAALKSNDLVTQSWVAYSLAISACQLRNGGDNPAQETSFNCEVTSRRLLLDKWSELILGRGEFTDAYLDKLTEVQQAGYLSEYVLRYFRQSNWEEPDELNMHEFRVWSVDHLYRHTAETRLTGEWSFED